MPALHFLNEVEMDRTTAILHLVTRSLESSIRRSNLFRENHAQLNSGSLSV